LLITWRRRGFPQPLLGFLKAKRKGTVAVRVNVKLSDFQAVSDSDFWPKHVYAREWISKQKWLKRNKTDDDWTGIGCFNVKS
jgi:hypothetical protein